MIECSSNPVEKQKDFHCLSERKFVAKTNKDGYRNSTHKIGEKIPNKRENEIILLDFLLLHNLLILDLLYLLVKVHVPSIKLDCLNVFKRFRSQIHSFLI